MTFTIRASLASVRMSGGEWKITLAIPASDGVEVAKIACACQEELLNVTIDNEQSEVFGEKA